MADTGGVEPPTPADAGRPAGPPAQTSSPGVHAPPDPKSAVRARVRARRAAVDPAERARRDAAIRAHLPALLADAAAGREARGRTVAPLLVCAYVPDGGEAGGRELPGALAAAGARVLLPVSPASGPLRWAPFTDDEDLRPGRFGILVPGAATEAPSRIADADLVLVPSVAVDVRGRRLGRGGGYYDRSLTLAAAGTPLVAVLDEEDVLEELPVEEHDLPVHGALTPRGPLRFRAWHSPE